MERIRDLLAADDDSREALRKLGGLAFGVGMLLVFFRRGSFPDAWGDFALFLVLALPCVLLYGGGLLAHVAAGRARPWEAVYLIFGVLLLPFALAQFVDLIGGNSGAPLNLAWIFLLTAVAAGLATFMARVRFGLLLACLALIVSWLALWDELLADGVFGDVGTMRGLLVVIAVILLGGAFALRFTDFAEEALERGNEVITAAGIALVIAGGVSIASIASLLVAPVDFAPVAEASIFWDAFLLVVSLALIAWGTRFGVRGPVYVGAVGLLFFVYIVGLDLDDESPEGKILGWPLLLVVLGLLSFALSVLPGDRFRTRAPRDESTPPPPAA